MIIFLIKFQRKYYDTWYEPKTNEEYAKTNEENGYDKDLIISPADVSLMTVMGQETYQVTGTAVEVEKEIEIPQEDIEMVANTAGVSAADAEEALRETGGDLAEAILKLNS